MSFSLSPILRKRRVHRLALEVLKTIAAILTALAAVGPHLR